MTQSAKIPVRVSHIEPLNASLRRITLEPADGRLFPASAAGAHIQLELIGEARIWRNAYSLVSPPGSRTAYTIIVRKVPQGRGGSLFLHERLAVGQTLNMSPPVNLFPIARLARKHLMLAAGIGVTPFLAYRTDLAETPFELHLRCRATDQAAFETLLANWPQYHIHTTPDLHVSDLLRRQPLGTHLYLCGPAGFMQSAETAARALGWPEARIHQEHFGGPAGGHPFTAILARSGRTIHVAQDQTLLEAIEAANIDAPSLCRGGACGECRLTLLAGSPDHRDHFLTESEHATSIMPCVSRSHSETITIDI
jgi:ferredoxin-NADP reductase